MHVPALVKCLAKTLVRGAGGIVGLGFVGDVAVRFGEEVWREWRREGDEQQRRAELAAIVQMAAQEFHAQVAEVVREVAADQPAEVQQELAERLEEVPVLLRQSLRRPADQSGNSVPPDLRLQESQDLVRLLSANRPEAPGPRISVMVKSGSKQGRELAFEERATCVIGRANDCNLRIGAASQDDHKKISRHHCLLDINPPDISIRDLGSRGGTYINGELIGKRPKDMDHEQGRLLALPDRKLNDGDEVKLCKSGLAAFRVQVFTPAADPQRTALACAQCGRNVASESGARPGEFVCADCRNDPERIMASLQSEVPAGGRPPVIQGYRMVKRLGQGGMGAVWLARHERTDRPVAIKVMLPKVAANERSVQRFLREMTSMRILNHRNVVRLWDTGYANGVFCLIMEYCDGGNVGELVKQRGGTLPVDEAVEVTLQALEGLHYAHNVFGPGKGLVHRDLKPINLFLSGSGSGRIVKVGDYGLAKAFDDAGLSGLTRSGEVAGTPHFMARNQVIHFKDAGIDVDIWAMAASLYYMLTGQVPRAFSKDQDPWLAVMENDAIPIRKRQPTISAKLAKVIDHALVEEPRSGYRNAAEFKDALEDAL